MKKDFDAYYDVKSRVFNSKHGSLFRLEYQGILNGLWIESVPKFEDVQNRCSHTYWSRIKRESLNC